MKIIDVVLCNCIRLVKRIEGIPLLVFFRSCCLQVDRRAAGSLLGFWKTIAPKFLNFVHMFGRGPEFFFCQDDLTFWRAPDYNGSLNITELIISLLFTLNKYNLTLLH